MSERQQALKNWVSAQLSALQKPIDETLSILPVAGDASFRRYYRVSYEYESYIVMDAPPAHEDCAPFVNIAADWQSAGVRVPGILAKDLEQGFLLLEDFGDCLLHTRLDAQSADRLYSLAMGELHTIQSLPKAALPDYDETLLRREMTLFRDWFLASWLNIELNDEDEACLAALENTLVSAALSQPQVVVHRDFHSRNLMLLEKDSIGVIDFQDAVIGAATYDLVSLLRDSYRHWPEERVQAWVSAFFSASPWQHQMSLADFHQAFDWMGMQRQLKVCGIFVRLCQRDGKTGYLQDIPLTLRNLYQSAQRYPEFASFSQWIERRVLPEIIKRPELQGFSDDYWWQV